MTASSATASVFGNVQLGHLEIESNHLADWRRFLEDGIGMHVEHASHDELTARIDDRPARFHIRRGPREDVTAIGWEAATPETFDTVVGRASDAGVPCYTAGDVEAAARHASQLVRIPGPKGLPQELHVAARVAAGPLNAATEFVAGAGGIGHVALTSKNPAKLRSYYATLLDARLTDLIDESIQGVKLRIRFLRVNERHHSVAVAATRPLGLDPIRTRVQHVNSQVAHLEDLTASRARLLQLGFGMALEVGQHTNDRELSYYAITPSGFEWEVGWNALTVDEDSWAPTLHHGISTWGHHPTIGLGGKVRQASSALRSLARREITVEPLSTSDVAADEAAIDKVHALAPRLECRQRKDP